MSTATPENKPPAGVCVFHAETLVHATEAELFEFHQNPNNLSVVMPPTTQVIRVDCRTVAHEGDVMTLVMKEFGLLPMCWKGRWKTVQPDHLLIDELIEGPFRVFVHQHQFEDQGEGMAKLTDTVHFAFGSGVLGALVSQTGVRLYLHGLFAWRHYRTRRWFRSGKHHPSAPSI